MTHVVKLYNLSVSEALDLVKKLEQDLGLMRDRDFRWSWHPRTFDPTGWQVRDSAHAELKFFDAATATFVELKYRS